MKRGWLFLAMFLAACGTDGPGDDPPDGDRMVRVTLGSTEGDASHVYAFAVRVSRLSVEMSAGPDIVGHPTNIDVLHGGLLLETRSDEVPRRVEVRFERPPDGNGVVPGERVAAYLTCSIEGEHFEFHAEELEDVELPVSSDDIHLRFDLDGLLDGITADQFEDPAPHLVDKDHNEHIADLIETRLKGALGVCDACE